MTLEFEAFPKIGRHRQDITITEKLDGTNGQIVFDHEGYMLVGSRKREIFPEGTVPLDDKPGFVKGTDNFAFAKWCHDNHEALFEFLGEGRHYGEWFGAGIQRGYGMDCKMFALFNTGRFGPGRQPITDELFDMGLTSVPVLYTGAGGGDRVDDMMSMLKVNGSCMNAYPDPEGVIVYHHCTRTYSKTTFEHDRGKWSAE